MSSRQRTPVKPRPSPQYQPRKIPAWDIITSYAGLGPIRRGRIAMTRSLVKEQRAIGKYRPPEKASYREGEILSQGKAAAERIRDQGADKLAKLADESDTLRTQITSCKADIQRLDDSPVVGITGDLLTAKEALKRMAVLIQLVGTATAADSLKHRRVAKWLRCLAFMAPLVDFVPLLSFTAAVFNVDWSGLLDGLTLVQFVTSVVFALLGSAAISLSLSTFGRDLTGFKDDRAHLTLPKGRAASIPLVMLVLSTMVAVGAAALMGYRVVSESVTAGNGITAGVILGCFFGAIVFTLHVLVFMAHYRDGSTVTDELDHLTAELRPIELRRLRLRKRRDDLLAELEQQVMRAETIRETTIGKLDRSVNGVYQVIAQARSYHQGAGWSMEFLAPEGKCHGLMAPLITIDTSMLDRLVERVRGDGKPTAETEPDSHAA